MSHKSATNIYEQKRFAEFMEAEGAENERQNLVPFRTSGRKKCKDKPPEHLQPGHVHSKAPH